MKFQAILDGITSEGLLQIRNIENEAGKSIAEIEESARQAASVQRNRILADGRARLNRECALIEQQATVQALQIHADARQKLIDATLENIENRFSEIRGSHAYEDFLALTIIEVDASLKPSLLENQRMTLHFDAKDKTLAEKIIAEKGINTDARFDILCQGGCTGETGDGMVVTRNTIESRFERANTILQQTLSRFFEEKITPI